MPRYATTSTTNATYLVRKSANGRTWDVVDVKGAIVEGGFFSRAAANACCLAWIIENDN